MADGENRKPEAAPVPPGGSVAPLEAYREALKSYDGALLAAVARAAGLTEPPSGRAATAGRVGDLLGEARAAKSAAAELAPESRLALTLMAVTETASWPVRALRHALGVLGVDANQALGPLLERGLTAVAVAGTTALRDLGQAVGGPESAFATLNAHPAALASARTGRPVGEGPPRCGPVTRRREADGLEPMLRLAALWQRVADVPLRQTQQGTLYKRDRDRLEDDPVLAGPFADALEPVPDMPAFWLALALGVGLLEPEPGTERVTAARPSYWSDNAIHLPRMIALRWLSLRTWHEQGGLQREGATHELALPYVRPAVLLWLATLGDEDWVTTADLAAFLRGLSPHWDAAAFAEPGLAFGPATPSPPPAGRPRVKKGRPGGDADAAHPEPSALEAMLLGAGYQLGLVRAAEEEATGRRAVQLTALGRYLLALGPPPPPRPEYEHFLFVQPNFEMIAYRQGLTPALVGQFSRFTLWTQVGAASAMALTPESVYRGLEGGMTPEGVLDLLARHSSRALPAGVAEAVRTWAGRRDRVTFHASATLVEFASSADLDEALRVWPDGPGPAPVRVSDRLVLVEDESVIPWGRFRMTGSRNYRLPAEACVGVEPDGVTLTLDLARSDLLVDAELARFADETPQGSGGGSGGTRRRFVVTSDSLARAEASGLTPPALGQWYTRRTGADVPPAVRLLLAARGPKPTPLSVTRPVVLHAPGVDVLDGLLQHPETRHLLGDRLGPTSVVISDTALGPFRLALGRLGLALDESPSPSINAPSSSQALGGKMKPR